MRDHISLVRCVKPLRKFYTFCSTVRTSPQGKQGVEFDSFSAIIKECGIFLCDPRFNILCDAVWCLHGIRALFPENSPLICNILIRIVHDTTTQEDFTSFTTRKRFITKKPISVVHSKNFHHFLRMFGYHAERDIETGSLTRGAKDQLQCILYLIQKILNRIEHQFVFRKADNYSFSDRPSGCLRRKYALLRHSGSVKVVKTPQTSDLSLLKSRSVGRLSMRRRSNYVALCYPLRSSYVFQMSKWLHPLSESLLTLTGLRYSVTEDNFFFQDIFNVTSHIVRLIINETFARDIIVDEYFQKDCRTILFCLKNTYMQWEHLNVDTLQQDLLVLCNDGKDSIPTTKFCDKKSD